MPLVNYCRKCRAETPPGEACPYCGGKLGKTGEQISFGVVKVPARDWFSWNEVLRVLLPAWLMAFAGVLAAEAWASGEAGVTALLRQGFLWTMLALLGAVLLSVLALMLLRGPERVHYVLDRQGVHARAYVPQGCAAVRFYARFTSPAAAQRLAGEESRRPPEGLVLVRRVTLPWETVRRVRVWREGGMLLFFRPGYWQVLAMRCPAGEMEGAEEYVRRKLRRFKRARVSPGGKGGAGC